MVLITDRGPGSQYTYEDLNRVEAAVEQLQAMAAQAGIALTLETKTDWAMPGVFDEKTWPAYSQMQRYLGNVRAMRDALGLESPLPESMNYLTWQQANQIEQALLDAWDYLQKEENQ